jgi:pimeloyl-ACP methyl ester carboxylesterase
MIPLACLARFAATLSATLVACGFLFAQAQAPFPKGQVVAKAPCRVDPAQSYALYLPSKYSPEKTWPILYAFDPGARGNIPVEIFRGAAEEYGYIVVGSNNSRNGPWVLNLAAARAMWEDTRERFALDAERVYMAGFSGGARVACDLAGVLRGRVAGVIACGAGFPIGPRAGPAKDTPFVFFGAVGIRDFNFAELKELDKTLDDLGLVHRIEVFAGGHDWPPGPLATEAVEWMEIQAMKRGKRERERALIDKLYDKRVGEARKLTEAGDLAQAFHRYQAVAEEFDGLRDVSEVRTVLSRMQNSKILKDALKRQTKRESRIASLEAAYLGVFDRIMSAIRTTESSPAEISEMVRQMNLSERRAQADANKETEESIAAERFVRGVLVRTYEQGRDALARKDFRSATLYLQITAECAPDSPVVHYTLARAYALNKQNKNALAALRKAVEKGYADREGIEKNADFEALRSVPGYTNLIEQLKKSP